MIIEDNIIYSTPEVISKKDGKNLRILLEWRKKRINFGTLTFVEKDASLYFTSAFHNGPGATEIELGWLSTKELPENLFSKEVAENIQGTHISLHGKGQVMHMRENNSGKILASRRLQWYPVFTPFNLLHVFSPPLVQCPETSRISGIINKIPDEYENSVKLKIDIFPRNTKIHQPEMAIWENWGYSPNYFVRTSILLPKVNTPALILWPHNEDLSL